MTMLSYAGKTPLIDPTAFVAPGARLIGDIEIGAEASIWYNCVLRGDVNAIRIGARSNIQDGSVIHVDSPKPGHEAGHPTIIGEEVLIGHLAMVHGCSMGPKCPAPSTDIVGVPVRCATRPIVCCCTRRGQGPKNLRQWAVQ